MSFRHREQGKDHFDLLPFIAILMCTLGCLLFVTLAVAALILQYPGEGWVWEPGAPGSGGTAKTPIMIEWDGATAVIHRDGRRVRAVWSVRSIELEGRQVVVGGESDSELASFLNWLEANKQDHYALFAVRPSGFESFTRFSDEFRSRQIDVGSEPIEQERPVALVKGGARP